MSSLYHLGNQICLYIVGWFSTLCLRIMMTWITVAYTSVYTLCWMSSIILIGFMIHYMKNKPLGMQTSYDPAIVDVGIVTLVLMTMLLIVLGIGAFTEGIGYGVALTLNLFILFNVEFLMANLIINHWHRYFMIFYPAVMMEITDQNIIKASRCIKVGITVLAFYMDAG